MSSSSLVSNLEVDNAALMEMFAMMDAERAAEFLANNERFDGNTLKPILGSDLQSSPVLALPFSV